jgi:glycosyltransferase involved in cell wall biosynthesis
VVNQADAIRQAIHELQQDPEKSRRIGDAARHTVMERFTVELMVRRTMEVYRQVIA